MNLRSDILRMASELPPGNPTRRRLLAMAMGEPRDIRVTYLSVDGARKSGRFKSLQGAQRFAQKWVGETPEIGMGYAVSGDGIGKVVVDGATLEELFPRSSRYASDPRRGATMDREQDLALRQAIDGTRFPGGWQAEHMYPGFIRLWKRGEDIGIGATPDWDSPNTISVQIDREGDYIDGLDIPVRWTGDVAKDVKLWEAAMKKDWPKIMKIIEQHKAR